MAWVFTARVFLVTAWLYTTWLVLDWHTRVIISRELPDIAPYEPSKALRTRRLHNITSDSASFPERQITVTLINSHDDREIYAYVVGRDPSLAPIALLSSGQWFHPNPNSSTVPEPFPVDIAWTIDPGKSNITVSISQNLISGRVYVSEGPLPFASVSTVTGPNLVMPDFLNPENAGTNQSWSYVELNMENTETFADISYVDFVGLPLRLELRDGAGRSTVRSSINSSAAVTVCGRLQGYSEYEDQSWARLCQYRPDGQLLRILSPGKYISANPQAFAGYYDDYVQTFQRRYRGNTTLHITDSNCGASTTTCLASADGLSCVGASRSFDMPNTTDIFGCSGTLGVTATDNAVVACAAPRLCAAFQRSTLLLPGAGQQSNLSAADFYRSAPTNRYAQLVHEFAPSGLGYAFPFDDVHALGFPDVSGLLDLWNISEVIVTVGDDLS